jgi:DNA replication protein DnaC
MQEVSLVKSWQLWATNRTRYARPDYAFPESYDKFAKTYRICPFCQGITGFNLDGKLYRCLCGLLDLRDSPASVWGHYESRWMPTNFEKLQPFSNSKSDAKGEESLRKLLDYVQVNWRWNLDQWMWIEGGTGTGKTTLLWAIKTFFGSLALYLSCDDLQNLAFQALRDTDLMDTLLSDLTAVPILLLDDFGIQHATSYGTDFLASLINARYALWKDSITVVTSNRLLPDLLSSPDEAIKRIASRMADSEARRFFHLYQSDYRLATVKKG